MVRSKIAFQFSADDAVLAILQLLNGLADQPAGQFTITEFPDENELLQGIVLADLAEQATLDLVSRVLLTVAGRPFEEPWVDVVAGLAQYRVMGLRLPGSGSAVPKNAPTGFLGSVGLRTALEQTPVPLCLVEGAEHTFVFANEAYVRMATRRSPSQLIGKTVREAFAEFEGQPFYGLLDKVYRTGEPFIGREVPVKLYSELTGELRETFFDFIYYPVRDEEGSVRGILCQAADVTDRVLDQQVREAREQQLYQQWAELDALYRTSPLPMALLRASDLAILRLNENQAALLGGKASDLVGRCLEDFYPNEPFIGEVLRKVIRDKAPRTLEVDSATHAAPGTVRRWTWNLNPVLNAVGEVESIASVALETTHPPGNLDGFLELKE